MKTIRTRPTLFGLIFFIISSITVSHSGQLSPDLVTRLSRTGSTENVSVLLKLAGQVDTKKLASDLAFRGANLGEKHREIIKSLQEKALLSQKNLVEYLELAKGAGRIKDFKAFWIANLIWVQAPGLEIYNLAARSDVDVVYLTPKVELVAPVDFHRSGELGKWGIKSTQTGLRVIKAPAVWALGYKGKGRLVCNIDTGVEGIHPALSSNWRGNFLPPGRASEAWYDPIYRNPTPNDTIGPAYGHGTLTMGIMAGEPTTSVPESIGVAPEALWIAARAIGLPDANWPVEIGALQWAADPDGNSSTMDDVPDVVSNSWGIPCYDFSTCQLIGLPDCWNVYWQVLDNLAAAGPVVVFAAGNEGECGASSVRNPADRIASEYNSFSVGSINPHDTLYPISTFSSLGPSDCDWTSKKPEVVAPGENIFGCCPGGYCYGTGTSFSAPYVAGAAALLRQINPNASSDEILKSLAVTAHDLGSALEDNTYGNGLIDVRAAVDSLPPLTRPRIYLTDYLFVGDSNNTPDPGEQENLALVLVNDGLTANSVLAKLSSASPMVIITDSLSYVGDLSQNDTVTTSDYLSFSISSSAQPGEKLLFTLTITANSTANISTGSYSVSYPFILYVTSKPLQFIGTHTKGNFYFTISNFGQYGFADGSINPGPGPSTGSGFHYPKGGGGVNYLWEAALMLGIPTGQVSDGARDQTGVLPDSDFEVAPGGELVFDSTSSSRKSNQDGFAIFTDQRAENPIGLSVVQRSYVYSDTANDDYVILEYTIYNQSQVEITGLRVGLFTDWDFPFGIGSSDQAGFARSRDLGYMYRSGSNTFRGVAVVSDSGVSSFKAFEYSIVMQDGFTDAEKWTYLAGGIMDTVISPPQEGSVLVASGPYRIGLADSAKVAFAILGSDYGLSQLVTTASRAYDKYHNLSVCLAVPGDVAPTGTITLGDIVYLVNYIFDKDKLPCKGIDTGNCWTPDPFCRGDVNKSGTITLGDIIHLVNYVFDKDRLPCLGSSPGNCWVPETNGICCLPVH